MKVHVSGVPYAVEVSNSMVQRISTNEYFMGIAELVASRGTCIRRKVGCVLINGHNHIIATGYSGVPSGFTHCIDEPCAGANARSGKSLELCQAIHAEQNALLQCPNAYLIAAAYCTVSPCIHCIKLLCNTSCQLIIYKERYAHYQESERIWMNAGRIIQQIGE